MQKMTLKALRVNKGLTIKEASKKLDIREETLSNYENSKTFPDVRMISKMEKLYGVNYNDIIFLN
ncbi:MAG: helix-turn-helix transcriptional regulator [Lachnospiraceae bacterium]|jgi:transcriptional regulator with XRE-family HTH domain|nr:helix-turn-helix transcriptional regulator [Lachnospiraceae bacterium]